MKRDVKTTTFTESVLALQVKKTKVAVCRWF